MEKQSQILNELESAISGSPTQLDQGQAAQIDLQNQSVCFKTDASSISTNDASNICQNQPSARKHSSYRKRFDSEWNKLWLLEISSLLVAAASLASIFAVLASRKDKPIPTWPSMLSINSLISIGTVIFKASIILPISQGISELKWVWFATPKPLNDFEMFDQASRGPWGSIQLLFLRPKNLLTSLAAIVTVLAMAADPFTQQVVQYRDYLIPIPELRATISRANEYSADYQIETRGQAVIQDRMIVAMQQAVLAPTSNLSATITFDCQFGNCTFPFGNDNVTYNSLGICVSVEDVTSSLIKPDGTEYQLPVDANSTLNGLDRLNESLSVGLLEVFSTTWLRRTTHNDPLFGFAGAMMVGIPQEALFLGDDVAPASESVHPVAFVARYYPCINTYTNASISNSILLETIQTKTPLFQTGTGMYTLTGDFPAVPGIDCSPSETEEGAKTASAFPRDGLYVNERRGGFSEEPKRRWFHPLCKYTVTKSAVHTISDYFEGFFADLEGLGGLATFMQRQSGSLRGHPWLLNLYRYGTADIQSVTESLQALADSMTAVIRADGDIGQALPASGTSLQNQTCVYVQWKWLTLPLVLLLLTLIFFVATVMQSQRHIRPGADEAGRGPWKSSALPLLWFSLGEEMKGRYQALDKLEEMEESGRGISVSLLRLDGRRDEESLSVNKDGVERPRWVLERATTGNKQNEH